MVYLTEAEFAPRAARPPTGRSVRCAPDDSTPGAANAGPLAQLYRRAAPRIYRLALAITASAAAAEDVVQETFVRALARTGERGRAAGNSIDDGRALEPWLHRVARNLAIDAHRRVATDRQARRVLERRAPQVVRARAGESEVDVERVNAALFELPIEQREVVLLRMWEGLSFPEIAERTDVPIGTVHSRFRYALARLRPLLERDR